MTDVENAPCRGCGRDDLPLHTDHLCPECHVIEGPCPAGGPHVWAEQDSGDAYAPLGGGPGTWVKRWIACDECGAKPPTNERNP